MKRETKVRQTLSLNSIFSTLFYKLEKNYHRVPKLELTFCATRKFVVYCQTTLEFSPAAVPVCLVLRALERFPEKIRENGYEIAMKVDLMSRLSRR